VAAVYGDRSLKKTQIYAIIKNVKEGKLTTDQWKLNDRRKIRNLTFIADVTANIEKDQRVTVRRLALAHGVSKNTIHSMLQQDLNLSKKSER
jgi:predicted nucleotidyltransferase